MESEDTNQETGVGLENEALDRALSHPVRRRVVEHLRGRNGEGIRLLTIQVTQSEADRRGVSITEIGHDRLRQELEEDHLPLLVDAGILTYNRDTEWIELNGHDDEALDRVLNTLNDAGD